MAQLEDYIEEQLLTDIEEMVDTATEHVRAGRLKRAANALTKAAGLILAVIEDN